MQSKHCSDYLYQLKVQIYGSTPVAVIAAAAATGRALPRRAAAAAAGRAQPRREGCCCPSALLRTLPGRSAASAAGRTLPRRAAAEDATRGKVGLLLLSLCE